MVMHGVKIHGGIIRTSAFRIASVRAVIAGIPLTVPGFPTTAGTPVDVAVERTAAVRTDILVGLIQTSGTVGLLPSHHFPKTGFGMMMKKRK